MIWTLAGAVNVQGKAAVNAFKLTFDYLSFEKRPAEIAEGWVWQRTSASKLY